MSIIKTFRLDKSTWMSFHEYAKALSRSKSEILRDALRAHVRDLPSKIDVPAPSWYNTRVLSVRLNEEDISILGERRFSDVMRYLILTYITPHMEELQI